MFHLELRRRPHVARAFNLSEAELEQRFLGPLGAGRTVLYADREWPAGKTKLTVYEGRELGPEEIGLGRGWGNVMRTGSDVTDRILSRRSAPSPARPELTRLKERLLGRLAAGPLHLGDAVALADDLLPGRRASERLGLTELAIWALLHERSAALRLDTVELPAADWETTMLRWQSWAQATTSSISLARSSSEANR